MKSIFEKDFFKWKNLKTTWEVRGFFLVIRIAIAAGVVFFLISSLPRAWLWGQMQWVRMNDISKLDQIATTALQQKDPDKLQNWLTFRPKNESAVILERIPPYASELIPSTFFELANRAKYLGQTEDFIFWTVYGRFRLRYDLLRCGSPDSIEIMNALFTLLSSTKKNEEVEKILTEPRKLALYLQKTLDFDATHPARNDPTSICKVLNRLQEGSYAIVPETEWAFIRHTLREVTQYAISQMNRTPDGISE